MIELSEASVARPLIVKSAPMLTLALCSHLTHKAVLIPRKYKQVAVSYGQLWQYGQKRC